MSETKLSQLHLGECTCVVRACVVRASVWFVWAITSTFMHGFQNNTAQMFSVRSRSAIRNICSDKLKVKVTLGAQTIKWSKLSLSEPLLQYLCMDFKTRGERDKFVTIPCHNCSLSGVEVSFEIFVQVG